ncbi:MAG: hypothetical protein WD824_10345 [Cyclobacteriaceae bacterium]
MMKIISALLLALIISSCEDDSPNPQTCHEGLIIGRIRSGGGGWAVSVTGPGLSTHEWNGFKNVVEALNIPGNLKQPGLKLYFFSRPPTQNEKIYIITADGDESAKPLIYVIAISSVTCPVD